MTDTKWLNKTQNIININVSTAEDIEHHSTVVQH